MNIVVENLTSGGREYIVIIIDNVYTEDVF